VIAQLLYVMTNDYRSLRAVMYLSGSYSYTIKDDIVLQSYARSLTYRLGGELDEIFLGEKFKNNL
jgi:hypothetical protein